ACLVTLCRHLNQLMHICAEGSSVRHGPRWCAAASAHPLDVAPSHQGLRYQTGLAMNGHQMRHRSCASEWPTESNGHVQKFVKSSLYTSSNSYYCTTN